MPFPMPPRAEARRSAARGSSVSTSLADHVMASDRSSPRDHDNGALAASREASRCT